MKHSKFPITTLSVLLTLLSLLPINTSAQATPTTVDDVWQLPSVNCGIANTQCEIRLSLEGDLYLLETNIPAGRFMLYVSRPNEPSYREYNLSLHGLQLVGQIEFVPFSDQNIVVFFADTGTANLSRLNLLTGEMMLLPQTSSNGRLTACNGYIGRVGIFNRISRLGTEGQLVFCSLSVDYDFLVNVLDVVTETTLHSYSFPLPWNGIGEPPSWNMLVGGQDGNIYVDAPGDDPRPIWQQVAGNVPILPPYGWRLYKYDVNLGSWSVQNVLPERMVSVNYPPTGAVINARIAAITENGDIIYRYDWEVQNGGEASEISHYDADFNLVERISSETLGRTADFVGISADGLMLVQSGSSLADLSTIQTSLVTPTPTPSTMEGFVAVQGRTGDALRVPVTIELYQDDQLIAAFNPTLDAQGSFTLDGVQPGVYQVWLKTDQTLAVLQTVDTTTGESHNFGTLVNGDVNNDNFTSLLDFSLLASTFNKAVGDPGYDARADLNGDDTVSLLDYSILASSYSQAGAARPGGGAALALFAAPRSAEDGISFRMSPASRTLRVGQEFDVTVRVQGNRLVVDGAALYLDFDPSVLQVVSMTGDTSLDTIVRSTYENVFGRIEFVAGALEALPTAPFRLVTIRFRATAPSTGTSIMLSPRELPRLSDITAGGDSVFAEANSINVVIR